MNTSTFGILAAVTASLTLVACKGSPASPFNTLQDAPITVYRLQNFEPPTTATTTAPTQPGVPLIPGLPPELQTQIQQGAQMFCSWLPPGTPGCAGGIGLGTTPTPTTADAPRFEGFRILGQAQVMDESLRKQIIEVFGYEKNFGSRKSPCLYPELGFSFGSYGAQPPANVLVSFGCNQVQARNFNWPFPDKGLKESTVNDLQNIVQRLFGAG